MSASGREGRYGSIAARLMDDHRVNRPFSAFAKGYGIESVDDAYEVQDKYVELRKNRSGARVAGYKIGLTSKKMQELCGIATPVAGVVLASGVRVSPATIDATTFAHFGLEFEIAVRIGRDIPVRTDEMSADEIEKYVGGIAPAIELVDDRNCDYRAVDALSLIADNAWNAGIVHGTFSDSWPNLAGLEGVAFADDAEIGRGVGRDVLGHPLRALAWLANHLGARGEMLRAGAIVMTGSIIPTQFPGQDTDYRYDVAGLGEVLCKVRF